MAEPTVPAILPEQRRKVCSATATRHDPTAHGGAGDDVQKCYSQLDVAVAAELPVEES